MSGAFRWQGKPIRFREGESVASALDRAGVRTFGTTGTGQERAIFCGIGQCQGCLVRHEGRLTEACLLQARDGMQIGETGQADD